MNNTMPFRPSVLPHRIGNTIPRVPTWHDENHTRNYVRLLSSSESIFLCKCYICSTFFRNLFSILIILYLGRNTRKWLLNRLCREIFRFSASFLFWSWVIDMSRRSQKTYVYSNRIAFVFVQYHFHVTRLTTPNSLCPYRDLFHRNWGCYVNL